MASEGTEFDRKSLKSLTRAHPDWDGLARDCVAFANARGGRLTRLLELNSAEHIDASISEIHRRIGAEIPRKELQRELTRLAAAGEIRVQGTRRWRRYLLDKTPPNTPPLSNRNTPPQPRSPKIH